MALTVTLTVLLLQVAPSQPAPHHELPQQQLLYYNHVIPAQQRQATNVVVVPGNGAGYVYGQRSAWSRREKRIWISLVVLDSNSS
jgi:hypothetical protein